MGVVQALLGFTVAAGLLLITPGLDTALILRTAALEGTRRALLAMVGVCVGCLCWGFGASIGLAALLGASGVAYRAVRLAGSGYLIGLGTKLLVYPRRSDRAIQASDTDEGDSVKEGSRWFVRGLLTNLLNPKVGLFYFTLLPPFTPSGVGPVGFGMVLTLIHVCECIVWFSFLIAATRPLSQFLAPRTLALLDRATGALCVAFGLRLALDR
jgi:threonine/homoserine/homoserine lactone efflux protein